MQNTGTHTYQEILAQPQVWKASLEGLRQLDLAAFPVGRDFEQVIFTGCGSTYYLSCWAARSARDHRRWKSQAIPASELWLHPEMWLTTPDPLVIAVSRSGATSETVEALKGFQQRKGGRSIVVTCYPDSPLAGLSNSVIALPSAQEESVAQTRSFTSMMLGISFLIQRAVPPDLPEKLSDQVAEMFQRESRIIAEIGRDRSLTRFFFLGSGSKYGLACEAMLKMKEMSLSYAEAYHFLEFRHGPMSMVDSNSMVIGLMDSKSSTHELRVLQDMQKLGARVLGIGPTQLSKAGEALDNFIPIPSISFGMFGEALYLPLLQLLAFERARKKKLDPDHPKNLNAVVELKV